MLVVHCETSGELHLNGGDFANVTSLQVEQLKFVAFPDGKQTVLLIPLSDIVLVFDSQQLDQSGLFIKTP